MPHKIKSIASRFEEIVKKYPTHPALRFLGNSMSYQELNAKANQLARHLQKIGVKKQDFVGIYLERSTDLFVGILAILKAGAIYVPIDSAYPIARKLYMIEDTRLKVLLTSRAFKDQFPKKKELQILLLDTLKVSEPKTNLDIDIHPLDLAYVNYTSGTTGSPKGVLVPHLGILRLVIDPDWIIFSPDDRFLQISNISFDALTHELWGALLNGATLCIYPQIDLSADELGKFIVEEKVTQIIFTSKLFTLMVEEALPSLTGVRYLLSVGDVMSATHAKIAFENLPSCHVINACGHTENTTHTTAYTIENAKEIETQVPIGKPIRGTTVYILDENGKPAPPGSSGEMCTGGDGLALGYLHLPDLTKKKFIPNPFGKGLLYRTGDFVKKLPDGNFLFLGRIDTQVKIRGFRIELSEIEETFRRFPQVSDCVVIATEDKKLIAYIESSSKKVSFEKLKVWGKAHLPAYMIPYLFVILNHFPMTPNGKVDKKALPNPSLLETKKGSFSTETEKTIGAIWAKVLHRKSVGREDHFFKLGGDSLHAMQVISHLRKSFGEGVSTAIVFQYPLLKDLAHAIDSLKQSKTIDISLQGKETKIPLSFNQESLWTIEQLSHSKLLYMVLYAFRGTGELNTAKLQSSLEKVVGRHEILRTRFLEKEGFIQSQVEPKGEKNFLKFSAKNEKAAQTLLKEKMAAGMDLTKLPLLQVILITISKTKFLLGVRVHHIIFDLLSYQNFFHEWLSNQPLPKLALQYGDFARWQRKQGENQHVNYWKSHLTGAPDLLELPWDKPRPLKMSFAGATIHIPFSKEFTASAKFAKKEGITPFVFFFSLFNLLLSRYSGKEDIVVGTPFAARPRPEFDPLIGYFLQIFVLRSNCAGKTPFLTFLKSVNENMAGAYKNSEIPLDLLVNALNPKRDPSFNPLFQVLFVFENVTKSRMHFGKAKLQAIPCETKTSKFDLTLFVSKQGCRLEYSTDLFEKKSMERMLVCFQTLIKNVLKNPRQNIGDIPLVKPKKRSILRAKYPKNRSVPSLFEDVVKKMPHKEALRFNGESMSFKELNEKANSLARHLQTLGVKPKDFVGIYLKRSDDLVVAVLGILKVGAVYVPIDESYPEERKRYMIENTGLKVLITKKLDCKTFEKTNLKVKIKPSDLAYINYTSGSTGKPKGIEYPHLGLVRLLKNPTWMRIGKNDRMLQISNISFDMFAAETFGALLNGATLSIYPQVEFSPLELGQFIAKEKITHLYLTSRLFTLLVEEGLPFLKKVKFFASTGDVMSPHHANIAFKKLPSCEIVNLYGPTENHITTTHTITREALRVSIGKPVQGTEVYILDARGNQVPAGVHGELFAGGDGLARGYLRDKEKTSEKFIKNPFGKGFLYRTGDLAKTLPDGNLDYLGRIDTQVKILGFRIEIDEIEEVIRECPKKVSDCIVIAKESAPGEKHLVAYIEGENIQAEDVREYIGEKLPKYCIPSFFVIMDKLPVTPNGKPDRKNLPSPTAELEKRAFEPPLTPTEKQLAQIWSHLLKIPKIGREDQFFHIGGHSILAMQLHSKVQEEFGLKKIPVSLIFEESTLKKYAAKIDQIRTGKINSSRESFVLWRDREAILDPKIEAVGALPVKESQYTHPKQIFLTGATGFVGAFFLKHLLENTDATIYCLVRGKTSRLIETLKTYLIWKPWYKPRIVAVNGCLEKPLFGLDPKEFQTLGKQIDSIFHIGAFVNHAMAYEQHKMANVFGTEEVLRLSCFHQLKPLHFISTVAVLEGVKTVPILEDADIEESRELTNGYVESKWIAEKLILIARSRGIPCNIFRLPRVGGDTKQGAGPTGDFLWRLVQASISIKMAPEVDLYDDLTPVDYICQAIHSISQKPKWINSQFHVMSEISLDYGDVFKFLQKLGYPLPWTDFVTWKHALIDQAMKTKNVRLQAIASLLADSDFSKPLHRLIFGINNLKEAFLKKSRITCPKIDHALLKKYIDYYVKTGFIP